MFKHKNIQKRVVFTQRVDMLNGDSQPSRYIRINAPLPRPDDLAEWILHNANETTARMPGSDYTGGPFHWIILEYPTVPAAQAVIFWPQTLLNSYIIGLAHLSSRSQSRNRILLQLTLLPGTEINWSSLHIFCWISNVVVGTGNCPRWSKVYRDKNRKTSSSAFNDWQYSLKTVTITRRCFWANWICTRLLFQIHLNPRLSIERVWQNRHDEANLLAF